MGLFQCRVGALSLLFFLASACVKTPGIDTDPSKVDPALVDSLTRRIIARIEQHQANFPEKPTRVHIDLADENERVSAPSSASTVHTAAKFAARDALRQLDAYENLSPERLAAMQVVVTLFFKGEHLPGPAIGDFDLVKEGLVLRKGHEERVFSPYGRELRDKAGHSFWQKVCKTAGLSAGCYEDPGVTLYRYPTLVLKKDGVWTAPAQ